MYDESEKGLILVNPQVYSASVRSKELTRRTTRGTSQAMHPRAVFQGTASSLPWEVR